MTQEGNPGQGTPPPPLPCPLWKIPCKDVPNCQWMTMTQRVEPAIILGAKPNVTTSRICIMEALLLQGGEMGQKLNLILGMLNEMRPKGPPTTPFGRG